MAGSSDTPDSSPAESPSPWATLRQLVGLGPSPVVTPHTAEPVPPPPDQRPRGALGLFQHAGQRPHAELFMSERTGDWIKVRCDCAVGVDHWHARRAD